MDGNAFALEGDVYADQNPFADLRYPDNEAVFKASLQYYMPLETLRSTLEKDKFNQLIFRVDLI